MKTITITITVPDGVDFNPVVTSTPVQNGPGQAQAPQGGATPVCPKHGPDKVSESQYGGWYCKAPDESNPPKNYCAWKQK